MPSIDNAKVCINLDCELAGDAVYHSYPVCKSCGEPLHRYDDFEFEEVSESPEELLPSAYPGDTQPLRVLSEQLFEKATQEAAKPSDTFTCEADLSGCPIAVPPTVRVPQALYNQWLYLAKRLPTEWIAYLTGEATEHGVEITGMYFPRQRASAAHCEALDREVLPGTIAAIHSHADFGVFFSTEDECHANHLVEIVVNNRGEILAHARSKLECGRFHRGKAQIVLSDGADLVQLEADLRAKIEPEKLAPKPEKSATFRTHHPRNGDIRRWPV